MEHTEPDLFHRQLRLWRRLVRYGTVVCDDKIAGTPVMRVYERLAAQNQFLELVQHRLGALRRHLHIFRSK